MQHMAQNQSDAIQVVIYVQTHRQ